MLGGNKLHDPAAHRPSTEVNLLQAESIEEARDDTRLVAYGVGKIRWLFTLAVSGKIGQIHAITRLCQVGRELLPIFGASAETVHQNGDRTVRRSERIVVNAIFIYVGKGTLSTDDKTFRPD